MMYNMSKSRRGRLIAPIADFSVVRSRLTLYGKNGNCTRRYSSKTCGIVIALCALLAASCSSSPALPFRTPLPEATIGHNPYQQCRLWEACAGTTREERLRDGLFGRIDTHLSPARTIRLSSKFQGSGGLELSRARQ